MYHLVYKIVNTNTGEYYIGLHSTRKIEDGYMGSGTLIRRAIEKHGPEIFDRFILHSFETRQEAIQKEAELVNAETLKDSLCYNLVLGGCTHRTIKERRELFSKNANEAIELVPIKRFHQEYKYHFKPIKEWEFSCDKDASGLEKMAVVAMNEGFVRLLSEIADLFNNKKTNDFARKELRRIAKYAWYHNNIDISVTKWKNNGRT